MNSDTFITEKFGNETPEVQKLISKDKQYLDTMAMIEETQRKNKDTLSTLSETIKKLQSTLKGVNDTFAQYDKFKDDFGKVLSALADNFGRTLEKPYQRIPGPDEEDMTPKIKSVQEVADELVDKNHIVFLTGAGLSVASGIPTFRGEGGYWTLRNNQEKLKATDFLTHQFFTHTPEEIWRWHHEFRKLQVTKAPNVSHYAIANLQVFCEKNDIKLSLITQNIDDFHVDAYLKAVKKPIEIKPKPLVVPKVVTKVEEKKTSKTKTLPKKSEIKSITNKPKVNTTKPTEVKKNIDQKPVEAQKSSTEKSIEEAKVTEEKAKIETPTPNNKENFNRFGIHDKIYEIHGNIQYMRCDKDCTNELFPSPKVGCAVDFVPECPNCKGVARPHTLFFDESYEEVYYRGQSLLKDIQSMDCLIVIGTALETYLATSIVCQAITQKKLIIEINPETCIKYGNVRHLIGGAETFIPTLCELVQKKMLENKNKTQSTFK